VGLGDRDQGLGSRVKGQGLISLGFTVYGLDFLV
jgi:hypothetical protein